MNIQWYVSPLSHAQYLEMIQANENGIEGGGESILKAEEGWELVTWKQLESLRERLLSLIESDNFDDDNQIMVGEYFS